VHAKRCLGQVPVGIKQNGCSAQYAHIHAKREEGGASQGRARPSNYFHHPMLQVLRGGGQVGQARVRVTSMSLWGGGKGGHIQGNS